MNMGRAKENDELILRQYREGDEGDLATLMANNFPVIETPNQIKETWIWQFKSNNFGEPYVMVAEDRGNLIAQYAVVPLRMNLMGEQVLGSLSTSTVTDLKYRGRGLFPKLAKLLYAHINQKNYKFVYGFPNEQSIKIFIEKLNWFRIDKFPILIKPINIKHILLVYFKNSIIASMLGSFLNVFIGKLSKFNVVNSRSKNIELRCLNYLPEEISQLWEMTHIKRKIAIVRDKNYLDWRYFKKPYNNYEFYLIYKEDTLVGYLTIGIKNKYGLKTLFILEIVIKNDDPKILSYVIDYINCKARSEGIDIVSMLALNNHPNYLLFIKKGFLPIPETFIPQEIYFCAMVNSENLNVDILKNNKNWYISWGDTDLI